jgi:hypothetical protein
MQETTPIACTLTDADLRDRQSAWLRVGAYATGVAEVKGGLAYSFRAVTGLQESLDVLIRLEAECCAWMRFALEESNGRLHLSITGLGDDAERGVREAFAPLSALVR